MAGQPQQQNRQPGLFGQSKGLVLWIHEQWWSLEVRLGWLICYSCFIVASTAAGVAVGSTAGHALGSLFMGNRGENEPVEQQQPQQPQYSDQQQYAGQQQYQQQQAVVGNCEADAKAFAKCLEENTNDISACQWYLDQLKSCRQMAQQY